MLGVFCILFPNLFTFKQKLKASVDSHLLLMYSGLKREANKRGGCFLFIAIAFFLFQVSKQQCPALVQAALDVYL